MGYCMTANRHPFLIQFSHLLAAHHQVMRQLLANDVTYAINFCSACFRWQIFQRPNELSYSRSTRLNGGNIVLAEFKCREIQHITLTPPNRLDNSVVPHATTVEETCAN